MLTIFCGGVHGVGKTSLCRALAESIHAQHVSAGELLRSAGLAETGDLIVHSVDRNQQYVVDALRDWRSKNRYERILLDGHFCLLTAINRIVPVPAWVFSAVRADALLVVIDDPHDIATRIIARDGRILDVDFLREFQRQEVEQAELVSKTLMLPLRTTRRAGPHPTLATWLEDLTTEHGWAQ